VRTLKWGGMHKQDGDFASNRTKAQHGTSKKGDRRANAHGIVQEREREIIRTRRRVSIVNSWSQCAQCLRSPSGIHAGASPLSTPSPYTSLSSLVIGLPYGVDLGVFALVLFFVLVLSCAKGVLQGCQFRRHRQKVATRKRNSMDECEWWCLARHWGHHSSVWCLSYAGGKKLSFSSCLSSPPPPALPRPLSPSSFSSSSTLSLALAPCVSINAERSPRNPSTSNHLGTLLFFRERQSPRRAEQRGERP
jgi:hypothetical protein